MHQTRLLDCVVYLSYTNDANDYSLRSSRNIAFSGSLTILQISMEKSVSYYAGHDGGRCRSPFCRSYF